MNILKVLTKKRLIGNIGEDAVCRYLKKRGYKIAERNYAKFGNEIDIIAKGHGVIAFVEVKTRTRASLTEANPRAASSVNSEKMRSIIKEARGYLAFNKTALAARFDVAEVYLDGENTTDINYMEGAFTLDTVKY